MPVTATKKKSVQKVQMRLGIAHGKYDHCLIDICHRGTDQRVSAREDFRDISLVPADYGKLHVIADKRTSSVISQNALGPAVHRTKVLNINLIESSDSLYNFTGCLHHACHVSFLRRPARRVLSYREASVPEKA